MLNGCLMKDRENMLVPLSSSYRLLSFPCLLWYSRAEMEEIVESSSYIETGPLGPA